MVSRRRIELPHEHPLTKLGEAALDRHFSAMLDRNASDLHEIVDAGGKEFVVHAEVRACAECKAREGRRYPVNDMAFLPPFHVGCRCGIRRA